MMSKSYVIDRALHWISALLLLLMLMNLSSQLHNVDWDIKGQLVDVFLGKKSIPMSVVQFPVDDDALVTQKELHALMKEHFEGKRSIPVSIDNQNG